MCGSVLTAKGQLENFIKPSVIFKLEKVISVLHYGCETTMQQQSDYVKDISPVNTYGGVGNQVVSNHESEHETEEVQMETKVVSHDQVAEVSALNVDIYMVMKQNKHLHPHWLTSNK